MAVANDLMLQVEPATDPTTGTFDPTVARAFYDSSTYPSAISFTCTPDPGSDSCTSSSGPGGGDVPEAPYAALIPVVGLGAAFLVRRRRRQRR